jgi:hypothetical protein
VRLCEATRPVVAGIYPKKVIPPEWPVMVAHEQIWADSDGLIECGVVPTGFLRTRSVRVRRCADRLPPHQPRGFRRAHGA